MRSPALFAVLIFGVAVAAAQTDAQHQGPHWTYEGKTGPFNWGKMDPEWRACSQGKEQSPIDIRGARLNKNLQPIEFHYMAASAEIVNNGHTIQINVKPGSYIVANGVRYDLVQFHFHHPSEEAVKGKLSDMVVHLVHRSSDGKLAVVAVRMREDPGSPNATLATLWAHMPNQPDQKGTAGDLINPGGLLPADRGYWTFMGSLTTPPCTEGVRWFVFEQELAVSREQLNQFAHIYKMNSRPLQDTHGRRIEANE